MDRITDEQWAEIERRVVSLGQTVELAIDGFKVGLTVTPVDKLRMGIVVWVKGTLNGPKTLTGTEKQRRFWQPHKTSVLPTKPMPGYKKAAWKKLRDEHSYIVYYPYWTSFRSMRRHLVTNNDSISLISDIGGDNNGKDQNTGAGAAAELG